MVVFWIFLSVVLVAVVLMFFDAVRQHPLGAILLMASVVYFLWRAFAFLTGAEVDDVLIWKILGGTAGLMAVVAWVGTRLDRKRKTKAKR